MTHEIAELEPRLLFRHFARLLAIPRPSGGEGAAREYVLAFARERGLKSRTDKAGNVVIEVPASPGRENAKVVVLQGHLDMVCEKNKDIAHDFEKDPIPAYIDGDKIRSHGTTLGADNGIGVAAALAVAEDPECLHGPLELLFTVDEETGLTGAFNLDKDLIKGRVMLNLDSEHEGTIFVGCAGGGDTTITLPVKKAEVPADFGCVNVKVTGLKGGHSGLDIALGRGNAIRILARAIFAGLEEGIPFQFGCLEGGNKRNAIPREASSCLYIPSKEIEGFMKRVADFEGVIRDELGKADPSVRVEALLDPGACPAMGMEESKRLLWLLLALPHGPLAMSQDIPGLVETSTNLAVIRRDQEHVTVICNSRSSVSSALEAVRLSIRAIGELASARVAFSGKYPGWRPNMESRLLAVAKEEWQRMTGKAPEVTAIHAGLECGVIGERIPGMEMISFGPDIRGAHSPDEEVSISSVGRFYEYLKALLKTLSEG